MSKVVVALGGNALGNSPVEQLKLVENTASSLVNLIKLGHQVVISHGNGPQVGEINLGMNYAAENGKVAEFPFPECGAMSQGYIGYHLQQSLQNELSNYGINKDVVTLITQVEVDSNDGAFNHPTKQVGDFYTKEQADLISREKGFKFVEDSGRGYRRVVPSPMPKDILELNSIQSLLNDDKLVIAVGGGGIPVVNNDGKFVGVPAVIDKDRSSAMLADELNADTLIILTAVDYVYINYNQSNQQRLSSLSVGEAEQLMKDHQFAEGSMLPKIEACLSFVGNNPSRKAIITSLNGLDDALSGKLGTVIHI